MSKQNKRSTQDKLKSIQVDFDKQEHWIEIENLLEDEKKKRPIWIFWFGIPLLIGLVSLTIYKYSNDKGLKTNTAEVNTHILEGKTDSSKETPNFSTNPLNTISYSKDNFSSNESETKKDKQPSQYSHTQELVIDQKSISSQDSNNVENEITIDIKSKYLPSRENINRNSTLDLKSVSDFALSESLDSFYLRLYSENQRLRESNLLTDIDIKKQENAKAIFTKNLSLPFSKHRTFDLPDFHPPLEKPIRSNVKRNRIWLSVDAATWQYSINTGSQQGALFVNAIQNTTTPIYQGGINFNFQRSISNSFDLLSGIHFSRSTERFNLDNRSEVIEEITSDSAHYFTFTNGFTQFSSGKRTKTTTYLRSVQQFNHHYNLGISIGLQFRKALGQHFLFASGTLLYSPITWSSGITIGPSFQIVDIESNNSLYQSHLVQSNYNLGVQWRLTSNWSISTSAQYKMDVSNRSNIEDINLKHQSFGLQVGIMKEW